MAYDDMGTVKGCVVYEPNQRVRMGLMTSWAAMLQSIVKSRELIWQLFKRDFFSNYKQSYLGMVWIFIYPVIGIISWVFLNATGVINPGDVGVPYPVYVLLGSAIWGLFISFYSNTAKSLKDYSSLILQINFPHEALVAKQIAQTLAEFLINIVLIIVVLVAFKITPSWMMVFFPLAVIPLMFIGAGIGMIISVVAAVAHDADRAVASVLGFMMFLTPVIYSPDQKSELLREVVYWNPLAYLVGGARDLIIYGGIANPAGYAVSVVLSTLFFLFSWRLFFLSEYKVAERL